jgi:hypothetical protein
VSHVAAPSASSRVRRRAIVIGSAIVAVALLAGGISAVAASSAQAAAAEQERVAARDALDSLTFQTKRATVIIDDAAAIASSDTALVSAADKSALTQLATSLQQAVVIPLGEGTSTAASITALTTAVDNGRIELERVLTAAIAASQSALDAAPLAAADSRQSVVDAQLKVSTADGEEMPVAGVVADLSTAVVAVADSQRVFSASRWTGRTPTYGNNDEGDTVTPPAG